jgi:Flp pilus assembly protein protease CpaA
VQTLIGVVQQSREVCLAIKVFALPQIAILGLALSIALWAAVTDWRFGRISNRLVLAGLALFFAMALLDGSVRSELPLRLAAGFGSGALFLLFWLFDGVGGGDVKLIAVLALFAGWPRTLDLLFFTALAGGVTALIWLIWQPKRGVANVSAADPNPKKRARRRMPYGVAIAAGTLLTMLTG